MTWQSYSHSHYLSRLFPFYEEVVRNDLIRFELIEDRIGAYLDIPKASDMAHKILKGMGVVALPEILELSAIAQTVVHGPKIYRPSQLNCEAMEHMTMNFGFDSYVQPYRTMVIELPPDYTKKRITKCEQAGEMVNNRIYPEEHHPDFVIVDWDDTKKLMILCTIFSTGQAWTFAVWPSDSNKSIEETYNMMRVGSYEGTLPSNEGERTSADSAMRIGINACSLLMEFGCKRLGPVNESHYNRCQHHLQVARKQKDAEKIASSQRELRLMPILYAFSQDVKLYDEERSDKIIKSGEHTGRIMPPHWRKGHREHYWITRKHPMWEERAKGMENPPDKLSLVKTKKPILVNKRLYAGSLSETQVVYHD